MSLDIKLTEAIKAAVEEAGQQPAVARQLIAWLRAINSGNEDISDSAQTKRRLEVLYDRTVVDQTSTSRGED